jgi:hypothetical protein
MQQRNHRANQNKIHFAFIPALSKNRCTMEEDAQLYMFHIKCKIATFQSLSNDLFLKPTHQAKTIHSAQKMFLLNLEIFMMS